MSPTLSLSMRPMGVMGVMATSRDSPQQESWRARLAGTVLVLEGSHHVSNEISLKFNEWKVRDPICANDRRDRHDGQSRAARALVPRHPRPGRSRVTGGISRRRLPITPGVLD